jgi:hypothetical protein
MEVDEIISSFVPPGSVPDQVLAQLRAVASDVVARAGAKVNEVVSKLESSPPTYIQYTSFDKVAEIFKNALSAVVSRPPPPPPPPPGPPPPGPPPPGPPPPGPPPNASSLTVTGFYGPSLTPNVLAVYLTQNAPIVPGMSITGLFGIEGDVYVETYTSNVYGDVIINPGPPSISFPYVSLVTAYIEGQGKIPVSPSSLLQITFGFKKTSEKSTTRGFRGPLVTGNVFSLYIIDKFTGPIPDKDWKVTGLSDPSTLLVDVAGNVTVLETTPEMGTSNTLVGSATKPYNYLYKLKVTVDQEQVLPVPGIIVPLTFLRPKAQIQSKYYSMYDPKLFDAADIKGQAADLRDLNSNVWTDAPAPREAYIEMSGRGFGTGALTAIAAIGAQEKFMYGGESLWIPQIKQHTPFVQTQRLLNPLETTSGFLNSSTTYSMNLYPRESGDLLSNMYLSVSLPELPTGYFYCELTGRAIIKKVEFLLDGNVIESITDDWYVIRDQIFLDADEKLAMYQAISRGQAESNVVSGSTQLDMLIPLDFFFCRRQSHSKKGRERLEKPFFPLCAVLQQVVTVRFTFNDVSWITNAPTDVNGNRIDLINPRILVEEITLTPEERMYYQSKTLSYKISRVWAEAGLPYNNGKAILNFTSKYPVSMLSWFVRNKLYESTDPEYYNSRYQYGYSTNFVEAAVPVQFFNGVRINFLDAIKYGTIYLNNQNILSDFPGALYYSYKQPMDHGLSVPTKNIYMYCFADYPREYNHDGSVDFSKLNSNTSHLDLAFDQNTAPQITQEYTLYLYYYGHVELKFHNGGAFVTQDLL